MVNPMEGTACRPLHPSNFETASAPTVLDKPFGLPGIFRDEVLNSWSSFFTLRQL